MYICIHICIYIYVCICVCMYIYICIMSICVYVYKLFWLKLKAQIPIARNRLCLRLRCGAQLSRFRAAMGWQCWSQKANGWWSKDTRGPRRRQRGAQWHCGSCEAPNDESRSVCRLCSQARRRPASPEDKTAAAASRAAVFQAAVAEHIHIHVYIYIYICI